MLGVTVEYTFIEGQYGSSKGTIYEEEFCYDIQKMTDHTIMNSKDWSFDNSGDSRFQGKNWKK